MKFNFKEKPKECDERDVNGFAWVPRHTVKNEMVWLQKYTRREICRYGNWLVFDKENEVIRYNGDWCKLEELGLEMTRPRRRTRRPAPKQESKQTKKPKAEKVSAPNRLDVVE